MAGTWNCVLKSMEGMRDRRELLSSPKNVDVVSRMAALFQKAPTSPPPSPTQHLHKSHIPKPDTNMAAAIRSRESHLALHRGAQIKAPRMSRVSSTTRNVMAVTADRYPSYKRPLSRGLSKKPSRCWVMAGTSGWL